MAANKFLSDREGGPIAELARLIAHAHPHEESTPSDNRSREETVSDGYAEAPELPPAAPQLTVNLNEHEQECERDKHCSGVQAHDVDDQLYAVEEEYQDSEIPDYAPEEQHQDNEVPRVRRHSPMLAMVIFGLAFVGLACAVGYGNMFGGSVSPTLPPSIKAINERNTTASLSEPQAASSSNAREVGPATTGSIDSREKQPATVGPPKAAPRASLPRASAPAMPAAGQAVPKQMVPRVAVAADPPRPPPPPPASGGRYTVQVTSERSESMAQAAFRALQAKYLNQLSDRQAMIRRADLGAAGIYYRALVGPFASAEKAAKLCSGLKAAGGDCVILKN